MEQLANNVTAQELPVVLITQESIQVECAWCWQELHEEDFPEAATSTICPEHTAFVLSQHRRGKEQ